MKVYVICYKATKPTIYNKGTKWEKVCDTFLLCQCGDKEYAEKSLIELENNREKIAKYGVKPSDVAYLFISYQEEMY